MANQLAIIGSPDLYSQAARRFLQLIPSVCLSAEKMFLKTIDRPTTPPQSHPEESATHPPMFTSSPFHTEHTPENPAHVHMPAFQSTSLSSSPGKMLSNTTEITNPFDLPIPKQRGIRSRSGSDASTSSLISMSSASSAHQTANTSLLASTSAITTTAVEEEQKSIGVGKYSSVPMVDGSSSFNFEYISPEMAYFKNLIAARKAIQECGICCKCWSSLYDKCCFPKDHLMEATGSRPVKYLEMEDVAVRVRVTSEDVVENKNIDEDNFDFGRFRSRATTVVVSSKISRPSSVKVYDRLQARRAVVAAEREKMEASESVQNGANDVRQTVTFKDKISPRLSRKLTGTKFEDKVGLFLKIVLEKLSDMLLLPPAVNILLTRLVSRLAQYPQPLLRSILLNHQLVLRPGIPNLIYVSDNLLS